MTEQVRAVWEEQLEVRSQFLDLEQSVSIVQEEYRKYLELSREQIQARKERGKCSWLERFRLVDGQIQVRFAEFGDKLPEDVSETLEEYKTFLYNTESTWKALKRGDGEFRKRHEGRLMNLEGANLEGADLSKAQLPGANLQDAQLQGADLRGAHLEGANFQSAQLQLARLQGAQLQGANFLNAHLENAVLEEANLQGIDFTAASLRRTYLWRVNLQGARLFDTDLTDVDMGEADLTGANLQHAHWTKDHGPYGLCKCQPLPKVRFPQKKGSASVAQTAMHYLRKMCFGSKDEDDEDDDDDEDNEDDEDSEDDDKETDDASQSPAQDGDPGHDENECCIPLMGCGTSEASQMLAETATEIRGDLQDLVEKNLDKAAEALDQQLNEKAKKATERLEQLMRKLDAAAKPQVRVLKTAMSKMQSPMVKNLDPDRKQKLLEAVNLLCKLPTVEKGRVKINKKIDQFANAIHEIQGGGSSRLLTKLINSQLQQATGYSSWLAFLKCSPKQMANDLHELEDITTYIEKLQETVNVNNWDDIVDNFFCLYHLHSQLKGERSCHIFKDIWKDEKLRRSIAVAALFQDVKNVNDPPAFVIHTVKDAVGHIKSHASGWRLAMKKEIAAIELIKQRQQAFFQFLISGITGFFMFIATLLSGLLLDAMQAGKVTVPVLSDLLNATA